MDVDFMLMDSIEAIRPKLEVPKTLEAAAIAVDEMFNSALQAAGIVGDSGESDESDDEEGGGDRRDNEKEDDEEDAEAGEAQSPDSNHHANLEEEDDVVVAAKTAQEYLGPDEEAEAEFAKELAKMVTDTSADSRKVDKKTALALWDSAVIPPTIRKKRADDSDGASEDDGMTKFMVLTKRGNKQAVGILSSVLNLLTGLF